MHQEYKQEHNSSLGCCSDLKMLNKMPPIRIFGFGFLHGLLLAEIEQGKVHITLSVSSCSNLLWHDGSCLCKTFRLVNLYRTGNFNIAAIVSDSDL